MDVSESTSSTDQNDEKEGEVSSSCDNSLVQTGPAPNSLESFVLEEDIEMFSQSPDTSVNVEQNVSQTLEVSSLTQNVNTVTPNDLAPPNIDTVSISTSNFCNERAFSSNVCPELEGIAHSLQLSSEIATLLVEAASTSRGIDTCVSNPDSTTFECVTNVPDDLNILSDEISTTNEDSNPVSTTSVVVTSECSTSKPSLMGDEPLFEIHTTPTNLNTVKESLPQNSGISTTSTLKTLQLKPEPQDHSPTHSRDTSLQSLNRKLSAHIHNESRPSTSQNSALITSHNLQPTISSVTSTKNLTNANIPTPPHDSRPIFVKKDDKFELIISKANESMSIENSRPTGEDMACSSTSHHSEVISDNSTVTSSLSKKPNLVTSDPQSSSDITTSNSEVSTSSSHKIKIKNKEILKTSASELISKSDTSPGAKVENQSSLSFSNINQSGPSAIEDMNTSPTQNVFQLASLAPEHIKSESNAAPFLASDKPFISADVGESPSLNKLTDKNKISVILVDAANSSQPGLKNDTDTNIFRTHEAPTLKSGIGSEASLLEIDSSTTNMPLIDIKKSPGDASDVSLKYTTKSPPTVTKSRFKLIRPSYSMPPKSSSISEPSSTSHIPELHSDVKATKKESNSKETSALGISEINIPTYNRDLANSLEKPQLERPENNVCSSNKTESFSKELTQEKQSTSTYNIVECGKKIIVPNTSTQVVLCASKTSLPTENKEIKSQNLLTKDEMDPIVLVSNKMIDLKSIPKKEDSKEYLKHENISLNTSPLPKTFLSQKGSEEKLSDTLVSKEQTDAEHLSQPSKVKLDQSASKIMTSSSQPLLVIEKNKTESLKGKECLENKSDTKVITTSSKEKVILKSLSVSLKKLPHNIETIGIEKLKSVVDDSNKQMTTSTAKTFMKCLTTIPIKNIEKKPNEERTFLDTSRQEQNACKTHNPTLSHSINKDSLPNTETVTGDKKALIEESAPTHSSPKVLVSPEMLSEVDPKYDSTSQTPARVCDTMESSKQIKESKEIRNNDEAQKNNTRAIEENSASGNLKIDEHLLTSDKKNETPKEIIINKHKEENVSVSSSSDIKSNLQFNKVKHEPLNKDTKDTILVQKRDENIAKATEKLTTSIIKSTETDNIHTVTEGLESKNAVTEDTTTRSTSKHKAYANQDGSKPISFSIVQSTGSERVKSSSAIEREISKVEKLTLKLKKDVKTHSLPLLLSNQTQSQEHIGTSDIKESTQLAILCENETKVDKVMLKIKKDKAKSEIVTIPSLEDQRTSTDILDTNIISPPNLKEVPAIEKITLKLRKDGSESFVATKITDTQTSAQSSDKTKSDHEDPQSVKENQCSEKITLKLKKDSTKSDAFIVSSNDNSKQLEPSKISKAETPTFCLGKEKGPEKIMLKLKKDSSKPEIFAVTSPTEIIKPSVSIDVLKPGDTDIQIVDSPTVFEEPIVEKITLKRMKDSSKSDIFVATTSKDIDQVILDKNEITLLKPDKKTLKPRKDQENVGIVEKNVSSSLRDENKLEKLTLKLKKDHATSEITAEKKAKDSVHIVSSQTSSEQVSTLKSRKDQENVGLVEKNVSSSLRDENKLEKLTLKLTKDHATSEIAAEKKAKDSEHIVSSQTPSEHVSTLKPSKDQEDVGLVEKNKSSSLRDENKLEKLTLKLKKDHVTSEITAEKKAKDSEHIVSSQTSSEHVSTLKPRKDQEDVGLVEKNISSSLRDENKLEKLTLKLKKDPASSEITAEKKAKDSEHTVSSLTPCEHVSTEIKKLETKAKEEKVEKLTIKFKKDSFSSGFIKELNVDSQKIDTISGMSHSSMEATKTDGQGQEGGKVEKLTLKLRKDTKVSEGSGGTKKVSEEFSVICDQDDSPSQQDKKNTSSFDQELLKEEKLEKITLKLNKDSSSLSISPKCHLKAVNADSEKTDKHSLKRKKELEVSCTSAEKKVKIGESSEDKINTEGIKDRICSTQQTSQPDIKPKEANVEKCYLKLKEELSNKVDCETTTDRKQISNELTVKPGSLDTMGNSKEKQAKEKHLDKIILKPDRSIDEQIVDNLNAKQLLHKERVETLQVVSPDQNISTVQQIKDISEGSMTKSRDLSHASCSQENLTISTSKSELKSSSLVEINSSGKCEDNLLKTKENTFGVPDKSAITDSECKRENKDHNKSQVDPIKSSSMPDEIKIDLSKSTKKDYLSKQIKMGSNSEASASIVAVSDQYATNQSSISKSSKKDDLSKQIKTGSNSESTTSIVAVSDLDSNIQSSISKSTKKDDLSKQIKTGTSFESTSSLVTDQDTKVQSNMSKTKEHKSDETPTYPKSNIVKISSDATEYAPNKILTSKNILANETKPEKITLTLKKAAAWSVKQPEGKGGGKQLRAKDTEVSLLVHQSDILLKDSSNKEIFEKPKNRDLLAGKDMTSKIGNTSPSAHIVANPSASSESLAVLTGSNQLDGNKTTSTAFNLTVKPEIATKKRESDTMEVIPPCKILKIGDSNAATLQGKSEVDRKITQSRCQAISRKRSSEEDNVGMGKSLKKLLKTDTKVHDIQVTSQLSRSKGETTLKTSKTKHLPTLGKEAIEKYSKVEDKSMSATLRKVNTLQTKPETQTNVETTSAHTTNIPKSSSKEIRSLFSPPTKCTKLENKILTSTSSLEREMKEKLSLPSLATKHPNLEIKTVESSQTTLLPITDRKRSTSPIKQFSASTSKGNTIHSPTHTDQTQKSSGALKVSAEDKLREILSRMGSRASSVLNSEISITLAPSKSTKPSGNFVETYNSGASDDIHFLDEVTSNEDDVSINLTPQISSVVKEGDDSSSQDIVILEEKITSPRSSSLTHQSGLFGLTPDLMDPLVFNERLVGPQINIATEFKQMFEGIKLPKKGRGRPRKLATDTNLKTKAPLVGNTCTNPTRPKRMCRGREERPLVAPKEKKPRAPGPGRGRGRKKKENEISRPGMPHILMKKPKLNLTSVATPGLIIPTTKIIKENISIETSAARPTTLEKTRPPTETPVAMTTSKMTTHTPVRVISESPYLTPGRVISESPYPTPGRVISESLCPAPIQAILDSPCPTPIRIDPESLCPTPIQVISESPCPTPVRVSESPYPTPVRAISESPCPTPIRVISEAPCPIPVRAISESPCPTPVSSTVQVFEEETRMSAESNSRSQTPARSLPPAVSVEGPGEESQGSVISTATTESNKNKKNRMEIPLDTDKEFTVDMISEYQWPLDKTGEHLMIQEQISQYLGVKSFKRKYPDIRRRPVEAEEKTYLRDKGLVSEYMSDLGLTAVISSEILDIMYADFQEKYEEYRRFMRDRQAKEFTTKQKAISAVTSGEKSKQDYKEKALSSAANWNATFNRNRREQRRSCFDLQSFTIQYPSNRCLKMTPEETPKVGDYPIALIPGQFTDFYKAYTPTELRYFPLNTVLYGPMKPNERQDPAIVSDDSQSDSDDSSSSNSSSSSSSSDDSADSDDSESSSGEAEPESTQEQVKEGETDKEKEKEKLRDATATCKVCSGDKNKNKESKPELLIHCGQCTSSSHPSCLDLTLDMVPHIKRYNWQCTDCKTCIQCKDPADEDKMLFCDMCDRGYHIYCVGLRRVPSGRWHCKECAVCGSCGTQQPAGNNDIPNAQWQHEYKKGDKGAKIYAQTLCVPCSKLWRKGRYCQLCWRCYGNKPDEEEGLINCSVCDKWMHAECCSAIGGNDLDRSSNFLCENCQEKGQARSSTIKTIPRTVVKV